MIALALFGLHPLVAPGLAVPIAQWLAQEGETLPLDGAAEATGATGLQATPAAIEDERARWRQRERELLREIAELQNALQIEQQRSLERQQEWIAFTRLLRGFELPALPAPPEFVAEALVEPVDPAAEAEERRLGRLRARAGELHASLDALLAIEGVRSLDVLEIGLLHELDGRTWTGPVVARHLDDRGRVVGMLKANRMRLEVGRAARSVTLVFEDGYESRAGLRVPFDGGAFAPREPGSDELVAGGGARRVFLGTVDPDPWIDALPELVDPEELEPVFDDGLWNLADLRVQFVRLLRDAATAGDPRWRLVALGGVRGGELRDVQFAELDALTGRPGRRVFADSARILTRDAGGIEIRLQDGTVRSGDRVAPFLAGRYRIVLPRASAETWLAARLPGLAPPPRLPASIGADDAKENERPGRPAR